MRDGRAAAPEATGALPVPTVGTVPEAPGE